MSGKIEALLRGLGQGASLGWNDELAPLLTPEVDDGTGIPRTYAAGSANADMRNNMRAGNRESLDKYPGTFRSAQVLGAFPGAVATGGLAGEGIAANGVVGGIRGGLEGAGAGTEGNRATGAAWGAAPGAILGMAGAAAPKALAKIKDYFDGGPMGPLAPAFATATTGPASKAVRDATKTATRASAGMGSTAINQATAKTAPPPRRQNLINKEAAGGRDVGAEEEPRLPERRETHAMPPPRGDAGVVEIPKTRAIPRIPRLDFGEDVVVGAPEPAPAPAVATNRPGKAADYMGKRPEPVVAPPEPVVPPEPSVPTTRPEGPNSMQDFERLMAGRKTTPPSSKGEFKRIRERDIGGRPTTPPQALAPDQEGMQALERSRAGMLPPPTDEALGQSMIMGTPEQRIPIEYSGKYPVNHGPTASMPPESPAQFAVRTAEQRALQQQAQGQAPGSHLLERPERGQSLFDATQAEPSTRTKLPTQTPETRGLPDSEHPTYDYSNYPSEHPMADGATSPGGEFDLGSGRRSTMPLSDDDLMTPSTIELDELPPSKPPVASTTKTKVPGRKTKPKDLMKRDD